MPPLVSTVRAMWERAFYRRTTLGHLLEKPGDDSGSPLGCTVFDGLTTDADGNVWVAVYGLGEVRCYRPTGSLVEVVRLPSLAVTSVTFGGRDLHTLFITSAGGDKDPGNPLSGALFALAPGSSALRLGTPIPDSGGCRRASRIRLKAYGDRCAGQVAPCGRVTAARMGPSSGCDARRTTWRSGAISAAHGRGSRSTAGRSTPACRWRSRGICGFKSP